MKPFLFTVAAFAFILTALHAQVPASPESLIIDPVVKAAAEAALPAKYASYTSLVILSIMMLGRAIKALQNGRGLKGWMSAIWMGTNAPRIIIGTFALLSLPACAALQKIGSALQSPEAHKIEVALADLGLTTAVATGKLSPGDAVTISKGVAIITSPDDAASKITSLSALGLSTAVNQGIIKPGDIVQVKQDTAILTLAADSVPSLPPMEITSGK